MLKAISLFLLFFVSSALLLSATNSALPKPSQTPKNSRTPESESTQVRGQDQNREENQAAEPGAAIQQAEPTPSNPRSGNSDQETATQDRIERFTGLLVLVGALQFIALIVQAFVFYRTLKENQRLNSSTAVAADAAKKSADVAQQTLREAEKATAVAQRAYLYVSGVRLMRLEQNNIEITYPIYNAGQTPGRFTGELSRANVLQHQPGPRPA